MNEHIRQMAEEAATAAAVKREFDAGRRLAERWSDEAEGKTFLALMSAATFLLMAAAAAAGTRQGKSPMEIMADVVHDMRNLGALED